MQKSHTQTTKLHKVKAHAKIDGNEQVNTLTKLGRKKKNYKNVAAFYEHTPSSPYYFQKTWWIQCMKLQTKAPSEASKTHPQA